MGRAIAATLAYLSLSVSAWAQDVLITQDMARVILNVHGNTVVIERNQDVENRAPDGFTKTSRPCPPFCIHPMSAAPGVETVGELELIGFLEDYVAGGRGLLIDSRLPDFFNRGTIPGAVNLPFSTMEDSNPYRAEIVKALGGRQVNGGWDFDQAMDILAFCNGPWCDQSPRLIRNLLAIGYPAEKLRYYRGGMQNWLLLGLSTTVPADGRG